MMDHWVHAASRMCLQLCCVAIGPFGAEAQSTWRLAYGSYQDERCVAVLALSQDQFVAVGSTGSFGAGGSDIYLVELSGTGQALESHTIGTAQVEQAHDAILTSDGSILITGVTNADGSGGYDGLLVKTTTHGEPIWVRTYGGLDWDILYQVKELGSGGYLLSGQTFNGAEPGGNAWLLRVDGNGDVLWQRTIGGSGDHEARSVAVTLDGGSIITGSFASGPSARSVFTARYDASGSLLWYADYPTDSVEVGHDIIALQSGGFSVVGSTTAFSPFTEALHLRLDADGEEVWRKNWGQINDQESYRHIELPTADFITIGYTKTSGGGKKDMFLLKSASDGEFIFGRTFGGLEDDIGFGLGVLSDGFICGGHTFSYGSGGSDLFLVRTGLDGATQDETVNTAFDPLFVQGPVHRHGALLYPNPSTGRIHLAGGVEATVLRFHDVRGLLVAEHTVAPGARSMDIPLGSGSYLVEVAGRNGVLARERIVILRP